MSTRIIKINRGDSFELPVVIPKKDDYTKPYFLTSRDALYFALMYPNQRFEDAIFVKGYRWWRSISYQLSISFSLKSFKLHSSSISL